MADGYRHPRRHPWDPGRIDRRSLGHRRLTISLIAVFTVANTLGVAILLYDIFTRETGLSPGNLLGRGAALWVTNVIVFSLWFWELDRGDRTAFLSPNKKTPRSYRGGLLVGL